jgi:hypothetical protein
MAGGGGLLSGQRGGGAFDPRPPAGTSWVDQTTWADKQLALLCAQHKGRWDTWHVPRHSHGYWWCAKPAGSRLATINVSTPENLAAEIRRQDESPVRGRELADLSTDKLQRVHRDLAVSIALAAPGLGAHVMITRQMQIIETELARRQHTGNNQAAQS